MDDWKCLHNLNSRIELKNISGQINTTEIGFEKTLKIFAQFLEKGGFL